MAHYLLRTVGEQPTRYVLNQKASIEDTGSSLGMTTTIGAARTWPSAQRALDWSEMFIRETGVSVSCDCAGL